MMQFNGEQTEGTLRRWVLVGLALAALSTAADAQSITAGGVLGLVTNEAGYPIPDVIVTLRDVTTGLERWAEANEEGRFAFGLLYPGRYELKAEQLGYKPTIVRTIRLAPGDKAFIKVALTATTPPVTEIDSSTAVGAPVSAPGAAHAFPFFETARMPLEGRDLSAVASLDTRTGSGLTVDGLPAAFASLSVDGVTHRVAQHPVLPTADVDAVALPFMAIQNAGVLHTPSDLEWGDFSGSLLGAFARRGTQKLGASLFADFSGSPGAGSDHFVPNDVSHASYRGGILVGGPIVKDTARFVIGAEAQHLQVPRAQAWIPTVWDAAVTATAADSHGVDLGAYVGPRVVQRELVSAFGRFDWDFSQNHRASVSASFANFKDDEAAAGPGGVVGIGAPADGTDIIGTGAVLSRFSVVTANELRIGFETSRRTYGSNDIPATRIGGTSIGFGTDPAQPGQFKRTGVTLTDAFQLMLRNVQLKLGFFAGYTRHDQTFAYGDGGAYWFSDPDALGTGSGGYLGTANALATARYSSVRIGGLLQNTWTVFRNFDIQMGLRWDGEWLPQKSLVLDQTWQELTGIRNDSIRSFVSKWGPRFGFRWGLGESGEWVVQGEAAQYRGPVSPAVMSEALRESGRNIVSRGVGDVGWIGVQGPDVHQVGARLTLLNPDFRDPGTSGLSFGVARRLGDGGLVELSSNYRHTSYIARRHDLNRLPGASGQDQYGRPIYGTLVKDGSVIAPEPGSNRRFDGYELVSAMDMDGVSDYWGVTARLERPVGRFLQLMASYTYSRTTDNWLTGRYEGLYGELSPFPDSLNGRDWADGTSDFDVPHRASVGIELRPLGRDAFTIAAMYQYASGLPFSPGFPRGADINGDGSESNDPAFIDDGIAGVTGLFADWPCLQTQVGSFAERNSCRDPGMSTLNLRVGIGPARLAGYPIELWVEMLNVTDANLAVRDHALFVVDQSMPLGSDPATGEVTVPLLINENFGEPVAYRGSGRAMRFGLRVNY
jgi:hypothetical protein